MENWGKGLVLDRVGGKEVNRVICCKHTQITNKNERNNKRTKTCFHVIIKRGKRNKYDCKWLETMENDSR